MVLSAVQRSADANWAEAEKGSVHQTLVRVVRSIQDHASWRRQADDLHVELYAGTSGATGLTHESGSYDYRPAGVPSNVCRMATDTLTAKISKQRPLPQVLASRGNWKQQKRAKKMTQFIEGEFYRQKIFEKHARNIVRDAGVFSRGLLKVWREGKCVRVERAEPREIFVDEWDARYGDPRNLFHVRTFDKGVLQKRFPSHAEAISDAVGKPISALHSDASESMSTVERVDVVEAWHLCDDEAAHEEREEHACSGRHVISVEGTDLVDEPWELPYFPFAVLRYNDPISGWHGQGLVEQLEGYQAHLNLTNEKLAEMYHMSGVGIWAPPGSFEHEFVNGVGVLFRSPSKPEVIHLDLVNEHMRARPGELTQMALNDSGLSQMSVMSQKPSGIQSGIALQTMDDVETERFVVFGRAYEAWCLDVARMFIDIAKDVAEECGEYAVRVPMRGGILDLKWADVEVDGYELKVLTSSVLPEQPGARLEKLLMLFNTGVWGRDIFLREFESLDIQSEMALEIADMVNVDERLESMLDAELPEDEADLGIQKPPGIYKQPTPYQNLQWAMKRAQQKLNKAESDGAPEWNLEMLRAFILDCEALIARETAPAANSLAGPAPEALAGSPMPPPMPGGAPPMPPPVGMAA